MRPLTEDESKAVFTKLANYIVRTRPARTPTLATVPFTGQESDPPHRSQGRALLLQVAQGQDLLRL